MLFPLSKAKPKLVWTTIQKKLKEIKYTPFAMEASMREAAVSIVFRKNESNNNIEILLIQRAKREGDPWSGHMAFPGGHVESEDQSILDAAIRETKEEISLDLREKATLLGPAPQLQAMAKGKWIPLVISPFLFALKEESSFSLNEEVASTHWIALDFFLSKKNRSTINYKAKGFDYPLPCYNYNGATIWGLTLRMIDEIIHHIHNEK